jgi:hypothetical protein
MYRAMRSVCGCDLSSERVVLLERYGTNKKIKDGGREGTNKKIKDGGRGAKRGEGDPTYGRRTGPWFLPVSCNNCDRATIEPCNNRVPTVID